MTAHYSVGVSDIKGIIHKDIKRREFYDKLSRHQLTGKRFEYTNAGRSKAIENVCEQLSKLVATVGSSDLSDEEVNNKAKKVYIDDQKIEEISYGILKHGHWHHAVCIDNSNTFLVFYVVEVRS